MVKLWTPTPRQSPDEWGAANRIYPATTGMPGPRDPSVTPYMQEWARETAKGTYPMTVMCCGAQMGKTDTQLDMIGERLDTRPAPILYVGPSKEFNTDQFEPRFEELIAQARSLREKVTKGKRQKKTLKWVAGVRFRMAHAGSSTALKSDPAALALVDEFDEMLKNVKGQGNVLGLVDARGFTFADFTTAVASTPSKGLVDSEVDMASGLEFWKEAPPEDIESAIWRLFQRGTMHHWAWPCPHCEQYFVPRVKLLRWPEDASPAHAGREAWLECPNCQKAIHDEGDSANGVKAWMNARGLMVARGQWIEDGKVVGEPKDTNTLSFWVSGLCSPFVSWGERAEAIVQADLDGDPDAKQTAINAGGGELYAPGGGEIPEWKEILKLRRPLKAGTVPKEAIVLTAGIDVQKNRLVYVIRAWGARATSWLVESGELFGATHEPEVWSDLGDLLDQRWDGLPIKVAFLDSGFRPGKPDVVPENMVYEFCRLHSRFVYPTKGKDTQTTPIRRSKIEVDPTGGTSKYGLELMWLDSDFWKSWVHERLRWPSTERGAWHLNEDTGEDYARQIVSEARVRAPSGKASWIRRSRDNHFLDCEALAAAAGYFLNVQRIGVNATREPAEAKADDAPPAKKELETVGAPAPAPAAVARDATADKFARMAAILNKPRR